MSIRPRLLTSDALVTASLPLRAAITGIFAALIVILSVLPGRPRSGDNVFIWLVTATPAPLQKLMHVAVYALLAILLHWTLEPVEPRGLRYFLVITLAVGLGAGLEWFQTTIPGRFGTLADVLLNLFGVLLGLVAAFVLL